MTILDGDEGNIIECDRCHAITDFDGSGYLVKRHVWQNIFKARQQPKVLYENDFCRPCAIKLTPWVYRLFDIYAVKSELGKLERAIREKRNQNNRRPANPSSECSESCHAGSNGH